MAVVRIMPVFGGRSIPDGEAAPGRGSGLQEHGAVPHQAVQLSRGRHRRGQGGRGRLLQGAARQGETYVRYTDVLFFRTT